MDNIKELVDQFTVASLEAKEAGKRAKAAKEELLNAVTPKFSEFDSEKFFAGDSHSVKVNRSSQKKWDSDELEAVFGDYFPSYIKRKFSISEEAYTALNESEAEKLSGCFTEQDVYKIRIIS